MQGFYLCYLCLLNALYFNGPVEVTFEGFPREIYNAVGPSESQ